MRPSVHDARGRGYTSRSVPTPWRTAHATGSTPCFAVLQPCFSPVRWRCRGGAGATQLHGQGPARRGRVRHAARGHAQRQAGAAGAGRAHPRREQHAAMSGTLVGAQGGGELHHRAGRHAAGRVDPQPQRDGAQALARPPRRKRWPGSSTPTRRPGPSHERATAKKVFIRSFGCQMNDYDSAKMADVLHAAEGYEPTSDVEQADLILFNTCSIREKAQEKVFSDLGRVKHLKDKGVLIGVGGCVASQEGAALIERAPYVDLVFGPQTLHRLPQMIAAAPRTAAAAGGHQLPGDREVRPPAAGARGRADGLRLDHGRLLEVLLLLRRALHPRRGGQPPLRRRAGRGGARWPTRACARSRCWGRTSMPTAGTMGDTRGDRRLRAADRIRRTRSPASSASATPPATRTSSRSG